MASHVDYAVADGIARITLVDGERGNPINTAMVAELQDAIRRARTARARVILLTSTGRFFCVGGDLASFGSVDDVGSHIDDLAEALHRAMSDLVRSDAVVVSAVQGTAAGAGFPLAAAADIVLASRSASFTLGYTKIGLSVDGGTSLLVHTLGLHRTLRLALLNEVLDAEAAQAAGLVAQVHDDADLASAAEALAQQLAAGPAAAFAATKHLLRSTADPAPERAMRAETVSIRERAAEPDGVEGVAAFLEKRRPEFGR